MKETPQLITENFPLSTGKICLMSCLRDILNYFGFGVDESMVFAFTEANMFHFKPIPEENFNRPEPVDFIKHLKLGGMKYNIPEMLAALCKKTGLEMESITGTDDKENKIFIKKYLDNKSPLLGLVNRFYMTYNPKKYRDRVSHAVNVYGYDFTNDAVYVSDTYIPTIPVSGYQGILPLQDFLNSLKFRKNIFNMEIREKLVAFNPGLAPQLERIAVPTCKEAMYNIAGSYFAGKRLDKDLLTGKDALKEFIREYRFWADSLSLESINQLFKLIHSRLTNYGGPYLTNLLLADFAALLNSREPNEFHRYMTESYTQLARHWTIIANLFLKATMGKLESVKANIPQHLERLAIQEEELYSSHAGHSKNVWPMKVASSQCAQATS
ncbi:MAG: BtrH N-terminal domain-containing protein [bacterium]|nr:BtrH N-terminal domain-containing protein [bacterium]